MSHTQLKTIAIYLHDPLLFDPLFFFFLFYAHHPPLPSFPTPRSSDLFVGTHSTICRFNHISPIDPVIQHIKPKLRLLLRDRKSTRLNSSHSSTSYAVFCLKKKNQQRAGRRRRDSRA